MALVRIDDVDDPRMTSYRDLPNGQRGAATNSLIVEGQFLVKRLLDSSLTTESVLCSDQHLDNIRSCVPETVPIYVASLELLESVVGFPFHRGVLACGSRPENVALESLARDSGGRRLLVICPNVADPANLGGVIRNCAAFGVHGLILGPSCADPYSRRVARVSMGAVFQLPIRETPLLCAELSELGAHGFVRVATVVSKTALPLPRAVAADRLAILFGGEGFGLDQSWQRQCDQRVTLPMQPGTDSLNLATASGVFLYHFTHVANRSRSGKT